jgi:hypothetical protein
LVSIQVDRMGVDSDMLCSYFEWTTKSKKIMIQIQKKTIEIRKNETQVKTKECTWHASAW